MKLVIFPVLARQFGMKDMGESYGWLHEWSEAYFVTLIDIYSFLCVSG